MALIVLHDRRACANTTPAVLAALEKMGSAHPRGGPRLWLVTDDPALLAEHAPGGRLARVDVVDASDGWTEGVERVLDEALVAIAEPVMPLDRIHPADRTDAHAIGGARGAAEGRVVVTWSLRLPGGPTGDVVADGLADAPFVEVLDAAAARYGRGSAQQAGFVRTLGERVRVLPWLWFDMAPQDHWPAALFAPVEALGTRVRPFISVPGIDGQTMRRFDAASGGAPWGAEQLKTFLVGIRAIAWHGRIDAALGEVHDNELSDDDTSPNTFFVSRGARVEHRAWYETEHRLLARLTAGSTDASRPGVMPTPETLRATCAHRPDPDSAMDVATIAAADRDAATASGERRQVLRWYSSSEADFSSAWQRRAVDLRNQWMRTANSIRVAIDDADPAEPSAQWRATLAARVDPATVNERPDASIGIFDRIRILRPTLDEWRWFDIDDAMVRHEDKWARVRVEYHERARARAEEEGVRRGRGLADELLETTRADVRQMLLGEWPVEPDVATDGSGVSVRVRVATALEYLRRTADTPLTVPGSDVLNQGGDGWPDPSRPVSWFADERAYRGRMRDLMPSSVAVFIETLALLSTTLAFGLYAWFTGLAPMLAFVLGAIVVFVVTGLRVRQRRRCWAEGRALVDGWCRAIDAWYASTRDHADRWAAARCARMASDALARVRGVGHVLETQAHGLAREVERAREYVATEMKAASRLALGSATGVWWTSPGDGEDDPDPAGVEGFSDLIGECLADAAVPAGFPTPIDLAVFETRLDNWLADHRQSLASAAPHQGPDAYEEAKADVRRHRATDALQQTHGGWHAEPSRPVHIEALHTLWHGAIAPSDADPDGPVTLRLSDPRETTDSSDALGDARPRFVGVMPPACAVLLTIERMSMRGGHL